MALPERRARCTLTATVASDSSVQPRLPQIILSSSRTFGKKFVAGGLAPTTLLWVLKSAWATRSILRRYLAVLAEALKDDLKLRQVILYLDLAPTHLHESIWTCARRHQILLQLADTHLFCQLKAKLQDLLREHKSSSQDGEVPRSEWLQVVSKKLKCVLPANKWVRAFRSVGILDAQREVSSALLAQLEWECCPCLKQGLPSEAEMQSIFPKGRRMNVMVYVNMIKKPPVRMHKGQKIRSLD